MRMAVRKLRVEDVEKLQALVVENFDAIEPGLTVLDARLLLGHATIDVIGVDSVGALVLGAVGFSANEQMLLQAVEAYSWCLEYPEALVRLYPSCQLSEERPPRLLFVVERMPDAFHRKIKQLGFPEVDCVEFRHLEFDGVPTVYFESLLRLRRGPAPSALRPQPEPVAPASTPGATENVITMNGAGGRLGGLKLPKVGQPSADAAAISPRAAERPIVSREPASIVSMVSRQTAVTAPWVERPQQAEPVVLRGPEPLVVEPVVEAIVGPGPEEIGSVAETAVTPELALAPEPVVVPDLPELIVRPSVDTTVPSMAPAHVPTAAQAPERVSFKDLADALLGATTATQEALAQAVAVTATTAPRVEEPLVLETVPAMSEPVVGLELELETVLKAIEPPAPTATSTTIEEGGALEIRPAEPVLTLATPETPRPLTLETALVPPTPTPAASTPDSPAAETAKPAPALPQGFEGLKFPNDGVLTRQWMEFLSQMSTTK